MMFGSNHHSTKWTFNGVIEQLITVFPRFHHLSIRQKLDMAEAAGVPSMKVIHWSEIERLARIPRSDDEEAEIITYDEALRQYDH